MQKLKDADVRSAKPRDRKYKLTDGGGLVLVVLPSGRKSWVYRYRAQDGRHREVVLGTYPATSLKDARNAAEEQRRLTEAGTDVVLEQQRAEVRASIVANDSFAALARAWMANEKSGWSASHSERVENRLEIDVIPVIGSMRADDIKAIDIARAIAGIKDRNALNTAKRVISIIRQVLNYGAAIGLVTDVPGEGLVRTVKAPRTQHLRALTQPDDLAAFLQDLAAWPHKTLGVPLVRIIAHTAQRAGEVRSMRWADIDWEERVWFNPVTKTGITLAIPLTDPVMDILHDQRTINGGRECVFFSPLARGPVSSAAPMDMIDSIGWRDRTTAHGFRATFRTLVVERLKFGRDLAEAQLSHTSKEVHGRAYDRTLLLDERREMMSAWSQWLLDLQSGASNVVPMMMSEGRG